MSRAPGFPVGGDAERKCSNTVGVTADCNLVENAIPIIFYFYAHEKLDIIIGFGDGSGGWF